MLRKIIIVLLIVIPVSLAGILAFSNESSSVVKIRDFKLKDIYGKEHSLSDYNKSKVILVLFVATQCPISNAYNKRMVELYSKYNSKNVAILGINSNKQESLEECKSHAEKNGFKFSLLKDDKNVIADMFEASVTPEAYILNPETFEILYHGRIDDSRDADNVESKDLAKALDEVLGGKKVSVVQTKAFGCTIKRI